MRLPTRRWYEMIWKILNDMKEEKVKLITAEMKDNEMHVESATYVSKICSSTIY